MKSMTSRSRLLTHVLVDLCPCTIPGGQEYITFAWDKIPLGHAYLGRPVLCRGGRCTPQRGIEISGKPTSGSFDRKSVSNWYTVRFSAQIRQTFGVTTKMLRRHAGAFDMPRNPHSYIPLVPNAATSSQRPSTGRHVLTSHGRPPVHAFTGAQIAPVWG